MLLIVCLLCFALFCFALLCFALLCLFEILLSLCDKSISILLFPYKNIEIYFIFVTTLKEAEARLQAELLLYLLNRHFTRNLLCLFLNLVRSAT